MRAVTAAGHLGVRSIEKKQAYLYLYVSGSGLQAFRCWLSLQNPIDIKNNIKQMLFECARPQGKNWRLSFATTATRSPKRHPSSTRPLSRFHYFTHHFCLSRFRISHPFLATRPFSFLFLITPYVPVTLFISLRFPLSVALYVNRLSRPLSLWCGEAAADW